VRFAAHLVVAWLTIVAAAWVAIASGSLWVSALAVFVIATRQVMLGLLVHEQVHDLAWPGGRWGDLAVNLLAGWPLMVITVDGYAQVHLTHHRYFFTERDQDFLRKHGPDWVMPTTARRLARLVLGDLLAINVLALVRGKRLREPTPEFARWTAPVWVRVGYYGSALAIIAVTDAWAVVLAFWILPLVTITQVLVRWGALCEHKYNLAAPAVEESSPIIVLRWWERLLLPNLNFTLHPYHHFWPGIPGGSLPRVHAIFQRERLVDEAHVFHGYGAYLRRLLSSPAAPR
jgi:fatty acid desaturase